MGSESCTSRSSKADDITLFWIDICEEIVTIAVGGCRLKNCTILSQQFNRYIRFARFTSVLYAITIKVIPNGITDRGALVEEASIDVGNIFVCSDRDRLFCDTLSSDVAVKALLPYH